MIVTVDEAKAHLRIEDDDEDVYLESLITRAQAVAGDFCRTAFAEFVPEPVPACRASLRQLLLRKPRQPRPNRLRNHAHGV